MRNDERFDKVVDIVRGWPDVTMSDETYPMHVRVQLVSAKKNLNDPDCFQAARYVMVEHPLATMFSPFVLMLVEMLSKEVKGITVS